MGRSSVVVGFILIVSCGLLCCAEPFHLGEPFLNQGLSQNGIRWPAQTDQRASNMFQSLIESRAPAAPWRPSPALVRPSSQESPMQIQSQRTNYPPGKPLRNQGIINPDQAIETFSQTQLRFQKPIPGPDLYPDLKDEVVWEPEFIPEVPEQTNSVVAQCDEVSVKVQVQQNFLGNNQFIDPSDLTLGGCPFVGFDDHARIIAFQSVLQGCGSTLTMTEDSLVYSFTLVYSPSAVPNTPIVKTNEAVVAIHCIYPRNHNVSSNALHPAWLPYAAMKAEENHLHFSLKLMTDDWIYERSSNAYFLGDFINLEASVVRANHVPLRVFVESCTATLDPSGDPNAIYTFIDNSGCMVDAKLTDSRSRFMSRIQDDKLQFQIEAFRFKDDSRGLLYITCHLKATTASSPTDTMNKACSFVKEANGWMSANGDSQICGCCETSCAMRKTRSLDTDDFMVEDVATIGPIFVHESLEDEPLLQTEESTEGPSKDEESSIELALMVGLLVAFGVLCIITIGTLFYQRPRKKMSKKVCANL